MCIRDRSITTWSIILVAIIWGMLLFGGYKLLDGMAKWIMSALTIATVAAVIIAAIKHPEYSTDFVEKTPWQLAALPFIVSLLGWMPAPIEISAINLSLIHILPLNFVDTMNKK